METSFIHIKEEINALFLKNGFILFIFIIHGAFLVNLF